MKKNNAIKGKVSNHKPTNGLMSGIGFVFIVIALGIGGYIVYDYFTMRVRENSAPEPIQQKETDKPTVSDEILAITKPETLEAGLETPTPEIFETNWIAAKGSMKAVLALKNNIFQLTYTDSPKADIRLYARGRYVFDSTKNMLTLTPDGSLGEPKAKENVIYKMMTVSPYSVQLFYNAAKQELLWVALPNAALQNNLHPLFNYMMATGGAQPALRWARIEKK